MRRSLTRLFAILLLVMGGATSALAQATPGHVPDGNLPRSSVPDGYKWSRTALFSDDAAFETALKQVAANRQKLASYKGRLQSPEQLAECLELYFKTRHLTNRLTTYASLGYNVDRQSSREQEMNERALRAMSDLMAASSFMRQEIMALDDTRLQQAYPRIARLKEYRPYLEELRRRRSRILDAATEKVLSAAGDVLWAEIDLNELPSDFQKISMALLTELPLPKIRDAQGNEVQLALSNYGKFRASSDRNVRRGAVEGLFGTLARLQSTIASTLSGQINFSIFLARARGYRTALEAYLDKDDIPTEVYHNLVRSVHANVRPLHRYVSLRKKLMGLDRVHLYDLYTPLVKSVKVEIPYPKGRQMVIEALAPLGKEYLDVLAVGTDPANGWIDVYPNRNKDSGAFCISVFGIHPFVLLNYYNELNDVSTLAHEMGHALHSHLSYKTQPYVTAGYSPFLAEIASTINEKLLSDYMIAHAQSDDEKLYLLSEMADKIRTTIYRQALFAEFELAAHTAAENGTPLTAEFFRKTYGDLIRHYYGPDFQIDPNDDMEWGYIHHFYYKYYVFSYATGLSAGIALAENVKKQGAPARDAYLRMLASGNSRPPLQLLRSAGVDLARPQAIEAAARALDQTLDEMEKILARRKP